MYLSFNGHVSALHCMLVVYHTFNYVYFKKNPAIYVQANIEYSKHRYSEFTVIMNVFLHSGKAYT